MAKKSKLCNKDDDVEDTLLKKFFLMDQRNVQPIIMIIYHDELGPDSWYGENHLTIIHQSGTGIYM